ncbi:MAG: hypothetical protein FWB91_08420 [Defluviitaleaceae bacterium]|nr:hypothetical protein [Defluviitaleaceae bacterium]
MENKKHSVIRQVIIFLLFFFIVGLVLGAINQFTSLDIPVAVIVAVAIIMGIAPSIGAGVKGKKTKDE